ncbi:hypothetical protein Tco_0681292 [Tanacetum coccineum]|uniref:Uncharacterized protein n=1 Tax=Tanacetum coccineum TaxID=301880 RepID=A0ABQ4XP53_9ASTR
MNDHIQDWYIKAEGESFDTNVVYGEYTTFLTIKCHYRGRFTYAPNRKYVEDEEHIVTEVEVNMSAFKFQLDGEGVTPR